MGIGWHCKWAYRLTPVLAIGTWSIIYCYKQCNCLDNGMIIWSIVRINIYVYPACGFMNVIVIASSNRAILIIAGLYDGPHSTIEL